MWGQSALIKIIVKGLRHEINNSFEGLKNQISTVLSVYAPTDFYLVMKKIKNNVLACFYENTY